MSLRQRWALGLALLLTPAAAPAQETDVTLTADRPQSVVEPPGPLEIVPEAYKPHELGNRYLDDARQFLKDHPDSPFAARMRFDMLLVADELEMEDAASRSRAALLIDDPQSRQSRWLLKTFHNADDFRTVLLAAVDKRPWDAELTAQLTPLFEIALERWPDKLIDKPSTVLYLAALASHHQPSQAIDQAIDAAIVGEDRREFRRAVDVLRDRDASGPKLFAALLDASIGDDDLARMIPEIETRPQGDAIPSMHARWVELGKQFKAKHYDAALVPLEQLAKNCPSQRVLWSQMLVAGQLGQNDSMILLEHKIRLLGPETAWAKTAEMFLLAADRRKECIDMQVRAWLASLSAAEPDRAVRMRLDLSLWDDAPGDLLTSWQAAFQSDLVSRHSFTLEERGEPVIQIAHTIPDRLRVYFPSAATDQIFLHDLTFGSVMGQASLDFEPDTGRFKFLFGMGMNSNPKKGGVALKTYFPLTEKGLHQFCDDQRYSYIFPINCEEREDCYQIEWCSFFRNSPDVIRTIWTIQKEGFLHSLRIQDTTDEHKAVVSFEYGNRNQVKLDTLPWPDLPEHKLSLPVAFLRYTQGGAQLLERYSDVKHPELQQVLSLLKGYINSLGKDDRKPSRTQPPRIATDPKSLDGVK